MKGRWAPRLRSFGVRPSFTFSGTSIQIHHVTCVIWNLVLHAHQFNTHKNSSVLLSYLNVYSGQKMSSVYMCKSFQIIKSNLIRLRSEKTIFNNFLFSKVLRTSCWVIWVIYWLFIYRVLRRKMVNKTKFEYGYSISTSVINTLQQL